MKKVRNGAALIIFMIITFIAIGFSVYTYVNSQEREETNAAIMIQQLDRIMQIEALIREKNKEIERLKEREAAFILRAIAAEAEKERYKEQIRLLEFEIFHLKKQLEDEKIIYIDATDDEHINMFLEWTDTIP